jgi:hypothetical protein
VQQVPPGVDNSSGGGLAESPALAAVAATPSVIVVACVGQIEHQRQPAGRLTAALGVYDQVSVGDLGQSDRIWAQLASGTDIDAAYRAQPRQSYLDVVISDRACSDNEGQAARHRCLTES